MNFWKGVCEWRCRWCIHTHVLIVVAMCVFVSQFGPPFLFWVLSDWIEVGLKLRIELNSFEVWNCIWKNDTKPPLTRNDLYDGVFSKTSEGKKYLINWKTWPNPRPGMCLYNKKNTQTTINHQPPIHTKTWTIPCFFLCKTASEPDKRPMLTLPP